MTIKNIGPTILDLKLVRNATNVLRAALTDESSEVVNITADTIQFNAFLSDGTTGLTATSSPGSHYDATGGIAEFSIDAADWASFTPTTDRYTGRWEVRRIDGIAREFVHLNGVLFLEVTTG